MSERRCEGGIWERTEMITGEEKGKQTLGGKRKGGESDMTERTCGKKKHETLQSERKQVKQS